MQVAPALLPFLLGFVLWTVAVLAWLGWRVTAPLADFRWRWLARFAAVPLIGWCGPAAGKSTPRSMPRDEGTWGCRFCYDYREEVRYWGWTLSASEPAPPCTAGDHDWKPVGCHQIGGNTSALYWYVPY